MNAIRTIALVTIALFYIQATPPSKPAAEGIEFFQGTWEEALEKAEKEHKMIFLDAYAAWCGPCKLLKRNVFSDPTVGEFFNENFINMAIDMEKGIGPKIASNYSVRAYPTLIFVNGDGSTVKQVVGYHNSDQLIELGKNALIP